MMIVMVIGVRIYDTGSKAGGDNKTYEDEADPGGGLLHNCNFKFHR